jgi:hypothetical protein
MDEAHPVDASPKTLTTGGIDRRWIPVIAAVVIIAAVAIGFVAWLANIDPLTVDTTAISVRPLSVIDSVEATSPQATASRSTRSPYASIRRSRTSSGFTTSRRFRSRSSAPDAGRHGGRRW